MKTTNFLISLITFGLFTAFTFKTTGYAPGDAASDFKLKNIDGNMVSLSGLADVKGAIVVFTCNHCPFSKLYEDRIIALDAKYKALGYPVVAINPNDAVQYPEDDFEGMKKRATEKGFTFPYLQDETQEIAKAYGAEKTPHVYILQKTAGTFIVKYIGAIDNNSKDATAADQKYAENALDELIAGKEVTVKSTKAVGCGVKWKSEEK